MALCEKTKPDDWIRNRLMVPTYMNEEAGGLKPPFFPSSAKTLGGIIPSNVFMDSAACGRHRVALNQTARSLFLQRKYADAIQYFDRVWGVDPEDLQVHHTEGSAQSITSKPAGLHKAVMAAAGGAQ